MTDRSRRQGCGEPGFKDPEGVIDHMPKSMARQLTLPLAA